MNTILMNPILTKNQASQSAGRELEEVFLCEPSPGPITIHAVAEPTRKRRGEAAEAAFLARATHLGFTVCLPWGDSERYDSVVDMGNRFLRVQVKSATGYAEHRYRVKTAGASGVPYTASEIDFFVAYIVPEDIWYIIPIAAIGHRKGVRFYPNARHPSRARFEKYREAWCLLACPPKPRGGRNTLSVPCAMWRGRMWRESCEGICGAGVCGAGALARVLTTS